MSKKKTDGDVLVNRLSVGLANHKKLLASWTGLQTEAEPHSGTSQEEREDVEFKDEALGHEQLGIGGKAPKEVQNGSFTRRTITSDDKLLQQLLGKKAAKAHIAARQAPKDNSNTQKPGPTPKNAKPEQSEDEDEGRAATFKSKRRKTAHTTQIGNSDEHSKDTERRSEPEGGSKTDDEAIPSNAKKQPPKEDHGDAEDASSQSRREPKPASYLDEILAERSKRKKKKTKNKANAGT